MAPSPALAAFLQEQRFPTAERALLRLAGALRTGKAGSNKRGCAPSRRSGGVYYVRAAVLRRLRPEVCKAPAGGLEALGLRPTALLPPQSRDLSLASGPWCQANASGRGLTEALMKTTPSWYRNRPVEKQNEPIFYLV